MYNEYVVVNAHMVISLGFCRMMPSSATAVFGNMVGKVNEGICFCGGSCWNFVG